MMNLKKLSSLTANTVPCGRAHMQLPLVHILTNICLRKCLIFCNALNDFTTLSLVNIPNGLIKYTNITMQDSPLIAVHDRLSVKIINN